MTARLYCGTIRHVRTGPIRHAFTYPAAFVAIDLETLADLGRRSSRLGYNRRALLRIDDGDYLERDARSIVEKLAAHLPDAAPARTVLLTVPRTIVGGFNPLSAYFVREADGALARVAVEVANTYGERWLYALTPRPVGPHGFTAEADKAMYVSPFHGVQGRYRFTGHLDDARAELTVDLEVEGRVLIAAHLSGAGRSLESASWGDLARVGITGALAWPRIVGQALRLRAKRLRPVMKPRPREAAIRR